jgi:hypothetical protein
MDERRAPLRATLDQWSAQGFFCLLGIASRAEPSDQATAGLTDENDLTFAEGVFMPERRSSFCYSHTFLLLAPYRGSS